MEAVFLLMLLQTCVFGILYSLFLSTPSVDALTKNRWLSKSAVRKPGEGPVANYVELDTDHFGDYNGTFQNRYWYNATYYKPGALRSVSLNAVLFGPYVYLELALVSDIGETDAEAYSSELLEEDGQQPEMRLVKRYNGVAVVWEHRYYGTSLPFSINENTTAEQWQYLTVEQALEDVVAFANVFRIPLMDDGSVVQSLHPSETPWVFIGGSYSGARAAFIRIRNPETIYASWASSGPVQAQVDMSSHWKAAQRSLPSNCSDDWVAVTKYVDDVLSNGSDKDIYDLKAKLIKAKFSGPGGNTTVIDQNGLLSPENINATSVVNAAGYLMDPLGSFQYYGVEPVIPFCDVVQTQNFTSPVYATGVNAQFGMGMQIALEAFLLGIAETDPDQIAIVHPPRIKAPDGNSWPAEYYSWQYQYCSEWEFYQGADPKNNQSIQTIFQSVKMFQDRCNAAFPKGLPKSPAVNKILDPYGGWHMNPTHVLFTNGEYDPWRTLSIASFEQNAPKRIGSSAIPACHTAPDPKSYFGVYTAVASIALIWKHRSASLMSRFIRL